MSRNMSAADARPANMRRTEGSAAVPAKPAAMSAPTATMPAASAAAGVCLECEKRHDEDQYRGHPSASPQH
jgi:hypothetical protein